MRPSSKQRGSVLVVITIAMLALIAVAGLALDLGDVASNKARLQASVDAAALSAAKVLDNTCQGATGACPTTQATAAANSVLSLNDSQSNLSGVSATVEYSNTLLPFSPGTVPPLYVRVTGSGLSVAATLARVVGLSNFAVSASAVAGPSPTIGTACNIVPMMLCGQNGGAGTYGYSTKQITALKLSAGTSGSLGPGNYMLLSLGGTGDSVVRQNLAGSYGNCATVGNTLQTQPGNGSGPVAQGLNTRFGEYQGGAVNSTSDPPDVVTYQPSGNNRLKCQDSSCNTIVTGAGTVITDASQYSGYSYEDMYQPRVGAGNYDYPPAPNGSGVLNRRVLAVPVGDCSVAAQGRSDIPTMGLACVFLLQDVNQQGNNNQVFGEVLSKCQVNGNPGPNPNNGPGPYKIQLYHVDSSPQS